MTGPTASPSNRFISTVPSEHNRNKACDLRDRAGEQRLHRSEAGVERGAALSVSRKWHHEHGEQQEARDREPGERPLDSGCTGILIHVCTSIRLNCIGYCSHRAGDGLRQSRHGQRYRRGLHAQPSNGDRQVFGEYLPNAQGEDIVAGIRTPLSISTLADGLPSVYYELLELTEQLERHYKDVQDFEFTVEQGKLFLLQTRAAKRAGLAAVKSAVDMANED